MHFLAPLGLDEALQGLLRCVGVKVAWVSSPTLHVFADSDKALELLCPSRIFILAFLTTGGKVEDSEYDFTLLCRTGEDNLQISSSLSSSLALSSEDRLSARESVRKCEEVRGRV